jgi:enoyl-[acyl-carrier protein] reductase III
VSDIVFDVRDADSSVFSLHAKRILVVGGTRGIGRALTSHFVRSGAHVIANYARDDDAARSVLTEAKGAALELCRADLTTEEGKQRVIKTVGEALIDGLIYAAATGIHRPIDQLTLRHWDFTFALNVRAFFDLVCALRLRFSSGASIVALSSEGAHHAFPNYGLVGASKGALEALCRHLALELAPSGIRVNVLSPGTVATQALDAFPERDRIVREAIERSPRHRLTTVEEVAHAAHFLCCDASAGLNGHTLVVDGGQRIRG